MEAIKILGLTKFYGKVRGVKDLELDVKEREFFGFIGPNGAGKSTTIRIILGLLKADAGEIEIFGKDAQIFRNEILQMVGYLPSEALFYPGMRVQEVIAFSAKLRGRDCEKEAKKLCERLELDVTKKVRELSLGNRKKLGIVCALQHEPKLCILDEPTSGLDPLMQREFFAILRERNLDGTTIFLSSHILSEIQEYCSRAAVIREGHIIACNGVTNLASAGAKRVHIRGNINLSGLSGIRNMQRGEDEIRFFYSGKMEALISTLCGQKVEDLEISEPDLEDVFLHYYEDGKN